jgi:hypothetical protein
MLCQMQMPDFEGGSPSGGVFCAIARSRLRWAAPNNATGVGYPRKSSADNGNQDAH